MNPRVEDLESRRLLAVAATPFALIHQFDAAEHLAATAPSHAHDLRVEALRTALEGRLGLAELRLNFAGHRLDLKRHHITPNVQVIPTFPAATRTRDHWASVVQAYQQALSPAPAIVGSDGAAPLPAAAGNLGVATAADSSVPVVSIETTLNPTVMDGQDGYVTVTRTGITADPLAVTLDVSATGPTTSTGAAVGGLLGLTNPPNSPFLWVPTTNHVAGVVTIPATQASAKIYLYGSEDNGAGLGDDTVTIAVATPPTGCSCCGGGPPPPPYTKSLSASSASLTVIHEDVSININESTSATTSGGNPGDPVTIDIHRAGNTTLPVTVALSGTGSTAVTNTDYSYTSSSSPTTGGSASLTQSGGSVTFPAGAADVDITVTPLAPTVLVGKTIVLTVLTGSNGQCAPTAGSGSGVGSPASATLTITPLQIQSAQWTANSNSPLYNNTNPGGGLAIFPDQNTIDSTHIDSAPRSFVNYKVMLSTPHSNIPIYTEVIDVDDPSANYGNAANYGNDPGEVVDKESLIADNKGDAARGVGFASPMYYIGSTDSSGTFTVQNFKVSMQPGDNYRIVASLKPINSGDFTAIQNDTTLAGIDDNTVAPIARVTIGPGVAVMSDMLTVWRHLHVEDDTMGPVVGNIVSGTMTVVAGPIGSNTSVLTVQPSVGLIDSANRFVPAGKLTDSTGRIYNVISNTAPTGAGTFTVTVNNGTTPPANGTFKLIDDDSLQDGGQVPRSNRSTLAAAMKDAYVSPIFSDIGSLEFNVPFILNANNTIPQMDAIIQPYWQSKVLNASNFWVAYVLESFQGPLTEDNDPDIGEGVLYGETSTNGGSMIYMETIMDGAREDGRWTGPVKEADTVVHEIAHAVGNISAVAGGADPWPITHAYDSTPRPSVYTLETINAIRNATKPWSP